MRDGRPLLWRRIAVLLTAALGLAGCKTVQTAVSPVTGSASGGLSEADLRERLGVFYGQFVSTIEGAATRAALKTADPEIRIRLTMAKLRSTRLCRTVVFQKRPMAAFLDTWGLCIQVRIWLETPDAEAAYRETRPILSAAAVELEEEIEVIASQILKPEQLREVHGRLEKFAKEHPAIRLGQGAEAEPAFASTAGRELGWLVELPLSPFRAIQGVDQTAVAVRDLTFVADRFTRTSDDFAKEVAWQTDLLLLQTRREVATMLEDLEGRQKNLQATLKEARGVAEAVNEALKTYMQMVKELYPPKPADAPPEPAGPPFDIKDYTRTAEGISAAAVELRQLLIEVQKTAGSSALSDRIKEAQSVAENTVAGTESSARKLADHITVRAIQTIGVFFAALLIYRVLTGGFRRKASGATEESREPDRQRSVPTAP